MKADDDYKQDDDDDDDDDDGGLHLITLQGYVDLASIPVIKVSNENYFHQ